MIILWHLTTVSHISAASYVPANEEPSWLKQNVIWSIPYPDKRKAKYHLKHPLSRQKKMTKDVAPKLLLLKCPSVRQLLTIVLPLWFWYRLRYFHETWFKYKPLSDDVQRTRNKNNHSTYIICWKILLWNTPLNVSYEHCVRSKTVNDNLKKNENCQWYIHLKVGSCPNDDNFVLI